METNRISLIKRKEMNEEISAADGRNRSQWMGLQAPDSRSGS